MEEAGQWPTRACGGACDDFAVVAATFAKRRMFAAALDGEPGVVAMSLRAEELIF
jgi:hypothetical protein